MNSAEYALPLVHGGDLLQLSKDTGIALKNCLDLSTGISPFAYPFRELPRNVFTQLPYLKPGFFKQASAYYGKRHFMPVPGTQAAIQHLPAVLPKLPILLPSAGYQEHALAWQSSGARHACYNALDAALARADIDQQLANNPEQHLLIINPNNPSTLRFTTQELVRWAKALKNNGCLIVDEAFIDSHDNASMLAQLSANTIVLRSFGKFFGLAGIRLGFVFADESILSRLQQTLPLWSINGPAACIAEQALADRSWQAKQVRQLQTCAQQGIKLFKPLTDHSACLKVFHEHLFSSYLLQKPMAEQVFQHFYQQGILLRLIPLTGEQALIRIGRFQAAQHSHLLSVLHTLPA